MEVREVGCCCRLDSSFFIDESSSNEDDEDEEEEESDGDTSDEADQVDRRVVVDEADDGVSESASTALRVEQTDREEQPSATVEDFLASMRTDPLFSTGSSNTLDYQLDRHIGTYSLSHLSPGIVSDDSSYSASTPSAHSSAASQHTPATATTQTPPRPTRKAPKISMTTTCSASIRTWTTST